MHVYCTKAYFGHVSGLILHSAFLSVQDDVDTFNEQIYEFDTSFHWQELTTSTFILMIMSPRVFFITGTSTGFGEELVKVVLEKGDIAVATARKPDQLDLSLSLSLSL